MSASLKNKTTTSVALVKPFLRGHLHQAAFFIAVGACAMLIASAHSLISTFSAVVYSLSLTGLLGVSALYHRPQWNERQRRWTRPFFTGGF